MPVQKKSLETYWNHHVTLLIIMRSFLFQIWKLCTITTINPSSQCLEQERKNISRYSFGDKIIQNCLKIDATHYYNNDYWDKKFRKRLLVLEADIITIKTKHWFDVSSSKDAFLQNMFQKTAFAFISVINHYHINGLHQFWDTLYK